MSSNTTPTKRSRRLGVRFIPKLDKYLARRPNPASKRKRRPKITEYGGQLMEKQKAKFFYNVRERQFRRLVDHATGSRADSSLTLAQQLETRLDNVVFRAGFAITHYQARQLVSHRHILVNGKKMNIPSAQVKPGESVTFRTVIYHDEKAAAPNWLAVDHKKNVIEVKRLPVKEDIVSDIDFEKIISFYSR
ncbi:30S ribosomal protein S4 [Candidatus Berkelbacteria bacterium]|nr:30S ribosomal protein S4 [Candidatus Berkelbacteria bacterium]